MVVGRVGKAGSVRVSVTGEVSSGETAAALVKYGALLMGIRNEMELAVRGGGAQIPRPTSGGNPSIRGCYGCGSVGHLQKFCSMGTGLWTRIGVAERCQVCGGLGHRLSACPGSNLPVADTNGALPSGGNKGGVNRTGGPHTGAPLDRGSALRSGSVMGMGVARVLS